MKTHATFTATRLLPILRASAVAGFALVVLAPLARAQAIVDPDPEIFDGTKTKREAIKQGPQQPGAVDDWEDGNMVVYDTNGQSAQGNGPGGEGSGQGNASDKGMPGGMAGGLPIPMGGGGGIPTADGGIPQIDMPPPGQQPPGAIPQNGGTPPGGAQQSADTSGAAQSAARPSDVSIGDPSQRIKTTAQGQAGNTPGKPENGEQGAKEAGEDSTKVPSGGSLPQSGNRGGGVEKGDTMPPDQI